MADNNSIEQRLFKIAIDGVLCASIGIAARLGVFDALIDLGSKERPLTPAQVAEAKGLKERYVRELLCTLGCGDIIGMTEDEKFYVEEKSINALRGGGNAVVSETTMISQLIAVTNPLTEVFRANGPPGLSADHYSGFYQVLNDKSGGPQEKLLLNNFIPALPFDIEKRLTEGGMKCLDLGCGGGFHVAAIAEQFPKSFFVGLDINEEALAIARRRVKADGSAFGNLEFVKGDAVQLDPGWTNSFDLVFMFDSCHDQTRPDLCLAEVHRMLKSGGVLSMLEFKATGNAFKDKAVGEHIAYLYGMSTLHCLPVGSNCSGALGLGTMWGEQQARELLEKTGFVDLQVVATPFYPVNIVYACRKP